MEKYLFVCHANQSRSPTAADVCGKMVAAGGLDIVVNSAGIKASKGKTQLSELLVKRADKIFVMEDYMVTSLVQEFGAAREKVVMLGIPDEYDCGDPDLKAILRQKLDGYLFG